MRVLIACGFSGVVREARIHRMPPSKDRAMLRSVTYKGIADAMAAQWSKL
jgi:hypothetical protein